MGIEGVVAVVGLGLALGGSLYSILEKLLTASSKASMTLMGIESQLRDLKQADQAFADLIKKINDEQKSQKDSLGRLALEVMHLSDDLGDIYRKLEMQRRDRSGGFSLLS